MEEQEHVKEQETHRHLLYSIVKWTLITMPIPALIALLGIVLGAINFASPTHYPVGIIAAWFTGDILLIAYVLAHMALLIFISFETMQESDASQAAGAIAVGIVVVIVGGGFIVGGHHFAWVSLLSFLILIGYAIGDTMFLARRRK